MHFVATALVALGVQQALAAPLNGKYATGKQLVIYGDSLSDDGDGSWVVSKNTWPADPAYYGHHFSNGPVWAQLVAKQNSYQLRDNAVGGATADNALIQGFTGPNSEIPVPSTKDQIANYLKKDHKLSSCDIYTIWIGSNDVYFGGTNVTAAQVASRISDQVGKLYSRGARKFLLPASPSLNLTPFGLMTAQPVQAYLAQYGEQLRQELYNIAEKYKNKSEIQVVDIYSAFRAILADPAKYGFDPAKVQVPCLQNSGTPQRTLCTDPDKRLFFDGFHPTRVGHRLVAEQVQQAIAKFKH